MIVVVSLHNGKESSFRRNFSDIRTCYRSLSMVLSEHYVEAVGHDASSLRQRIGDYFVALFDDVLFVYFFKNKFRIYNIIFILSLTLLKQSWTNV